MADELDQVLTLAAQAVRAGGAVAEELRGSQDGHFSWKGGRDPFVSQSMDVQAAVTGAIRRAYPDAAILAEEGPEDEPLPFDANPLWMVDPICGSLNYMHGDPSYAVAVGFRADGVWQMGAVYEPARDHLYTAIDGRGAQLNGRAIVVDQFGDGTEAINRAVVGIEWPGEIGPRAEMLNVVNTLSPSTLSLRSVGSPALALCSVARGALHGYVGLGLKPWDVVPGAIVLQEAGGTLTNFTGSSWYYSEDGGYIASNSVIHGRLFQATGVVLTLRRMSAERLAEAAARAATGPAPDPRP